MKKLILLWLGAVFLPPSFAVLAGDVVNPASRERRAQVIDAVVSKCAAPGGLNVGWEECFPFAEAMFASGHVAEARRLASRGLEALSPGNKLNPRWLHGGNSGFAAWPGLDCYLRYQPNLGDELRARYREVYTGAAFYRRLSTSNHKIMAAVNRCLATQVWGADAIKPDPRLGDPDGNCFAKDDPTGEKYVRHIIQTTLADGPGEYASMPYGIQNLLPLLTLAEFAADPGIRKTSLAAYEHSLWQLAPAWLHGHLATYSFRSYPDMLSQQPWGLASMMWLYFGGQPPADPARGYLPLAATASYEPPPDLIAAGTDRSKSYVARTRVGPLALYHFVNRTYALFSHSSRAGKPIGGQVYPSGVMWDEPDPARASQFWVTNPTADAPAAAGSALQPVSGLHTHGVSGLEREVQHRDALLSVFRLGSTARFPYVLGYVPGGYRAVINESKATGNIYLDYGTVLIAFAATKPFDWDPNLPMKAPAGPPHAGDSEFRIPGPDLATAIETASPSEFPGSTPEARLASFREAMKSRASLTLTDTGALSALYHDRAGNQIRCAYDGADTINGSAVDYRLWPDLESPSRTQ